MKLYSTFALLIFSLLLNLACGSKNILCSEIVAQGNAEKTVAQIDKDWEMMRFSDGFLAAMAAFGEKGEIVLIGSDFRISKDGGQTWKIITEGKGFNRCTSDGGKTFDKDCGIDSKQPKKLTVEDVVYLGNVNNAVLDGDGRVYLTSFYEHHGALWSIPLESPKELWFGLHFTYDDEPNDMNYWTTDSFIRLKNKVFVSASGQSEAGMFWLTTADKGKSWQRAKFNLSSDRFFVDADNGLRTVENQIEQTFDGGKSWIILQTPKMPAGGFDSIFIDDKTGFAVGENGLLATTKDGGDTWKTFDSGMKETLYGVAALDENNAWAVGEKGLIFETSDGGKTWRGVDLGFEKDIYSTLYDNSIRIDKLRRTVWIIEDGKVYRKIVG